MWRSKWTDLQASQGEGVHMLAPLQAQQAGHAGFCSLPTPITLQTLRAVPDRINPSQSKASRALSRLNSRVLAAKAPCSGCLPFAPSPQMRLVLYSNLAPSASAKRGPPARRGSARPFPVSSGPVAFRPVGPMSSKCNVATISSFHHGLDDHHCEPPQLRLRRRASQACSPSLDVSGPVACCFPWHAAGVAPSRCRC